ncbi:hypothetical protein GCM10028777_24060 [Angustibacter speluncae]
MTAGRRLRVTGRGGALPDGCDMALKAWSVPSDTGRMAAPRTSSTPSPAILVLLDPQPRDGDADRPQGGRT